MERIVLTEFAHTHANAWEKLIENIGQGIRGIEAIIPHLDGREKIQTCIFAVNVSLQKAQREIDHFRQILDAIEDTNDAHSLELLVEDLWSIGFKSMLLALQEVHKNLNALIALQKREG